jgi:hypothetical protein
MTIKNTTGDIRVIRNLGMIAVLSGLIALTSSVCFAQTPPPANAVIVAGTAPALCWSAPGTNWVQNGASAGNFSAGSGFAGGATVSILESQLVDANKRAALSFGNSGENAMRMRFSVNCNSPVVAQLSAQYGRLQNTDALALPAGMPAQRTATTSATFENYYPYKIEYGFINTLTGAQPPNASHKVNGSAGYTNPLNGSAGGGAPPSWSSVTSAGAWFSIKRVDVRIDLDPPPLVNGGTVRPVMIAGSYSDRLTLTLTPSL